MASVKVSVGLAGEGFSYAGGETVDRDVFASKVGTGWWNLCTELDGTAIAAPRAAEVPAASEEGAIAPDADAAEVEAPKRTRAKKD